ncbi:succinylglutamate-semialdehyde dehydrogenase [Brevundimonas sp.]|uniref:succinylglutamate-semialdehyde dehydrogenase n=1 Tax=Brevundimonas sp. TaxID=1871086 RepID=UPI003D117294
MNADQMSCLVGGRAFTPRGAGKEVISLDPFTGSEHWHATGAGIEEVDAAVQAARAAFRGWSTTPPEVRSECLERFAIRVRERADELAQLISRENGKPLWDARVEVNSLASKVDATVEAFRTRAGESSREVRGMISRTRFLPHGVMVVLGPFNFPMSMGNSHIMPALLAGNTVVFKPSELTPLSGLVMSTIWQEAGLPPGVLNCLSGGRDVGEALVTHGDIDGVLFVGSHSGGIGILRALVEHPEKIVALEMGGNSPLVVWDYDDLDVAAHIALQSSMVTAGQRCSAARRLIVPEGDTRLLPRLAEILNKLRIGHHADTPEPYYGPVIRPRAAEVALTRYEALAAAGAKTWVAPAKGGPWGTLVSPGLVDVTGCPADHDEEIFGPVLKVYTAATLEEAIALSNQTRFGLAAGIVTRSADNYERYLREVRAGIVNWNQQLTGATMFAPFGGVKQSGNFRSAGFMSTDYCSYPIAAFEVDRPTLPETLSPGLNL